jgi:hypothetical protein
MAMMQMVLLLAQDGAEYDGAHDYSSRFTATVVAIATIVVSSASISVGGRDHSCEKHGCNDKELFHKTLLRSKIKYQILLILYHTLIQKVKP